MGRKPGKNLAMYLRRFTGLTELQSNSLLKMRDELFANGFSEEHIKKVLYLKSKKLLNYRATRIARTELTTAYNQAMKAQLMEAVSDGVQAGEGRVTKVWYAAMDERVCDICGELHEQVAGLDETFEGGYDTPSAHPNCRCTLLTYLQRG